MSPAAALVLLAVGALAGEPRGVVVLRVEPGSVAERAGLRPGDRLASWGQGEGSEAVGGTLSSPFDVMDIEVERAPRGAVRILGSRGAEELTVSLFPDEWGLTLRPPFADADRAAVDDALRQAERGGIEGDALSLRALALRLGEPADARSWLLLQAAQVQVGARRLDEAKALVEEAAQGARTTLKAHLYTLLGEACDSQDRYDDARGAFSQALALRQEAAPGGLAVAASLHQIAAVARRRGTGIEEAASRVEEARAIVERLAPRSVALVRTLETRIQLASADRAGGLEAARPLIERALALAEDLCPDSLPLAGILHQAAWLTKDQERRLAVGRRALAIRERLAAGGLDVAASLRQVGWTLMSMGDISPAEEHLGRSLEIVQRLAPGSRQHAAILNDQAVLRGDRGDLAAAETFYRRSIEISERILPDSLWLSAGLVSLAEVLRLRHELSDAESLLRRALAILEREAPRSDVLGHCLANLGSIARERGDATGAAALLRRAVAVFRRENRQAAPDIAYSLGDVLMDLGRIGDAEALYRETLERSEVRAPRGLFSAQGHAALGRSALQRADLGAAQKHHETALALWEELAPGSLQEAECSHALGLIARTRGRSEDALAFFRRAVSALEAQSRRLGGDKDVQAGFRSRYQEYYRDLEELLLELGHRDAAFAIVERSRARGLLALLAARDLQFKGDVPDELETERRKADAGYDRILRELASAKEDTERSGLRRKLEEARQRQDAARARLRAAAPRLAALRDPEPLDLAGVRRVLDPGTLLLSFSIGPKAARAYAVGPGPEDFAVLPIRVSEATLRAEVTRFRELIETRRSALLRGALRAQGEKLAQVLLAPAADLVSRAERLLIVPDGVLHLLPFAALDDPTDPKGRRYLVDSKPLHVVSSVTVYAQLSRPRGSSDSALQVIGFADPAYPAAPGEGPPKPALRRAPGSGLRLQPLPWTRREMDGLKALAADAQVFVGSEATEERAKSIGRGVRVLHFACHGFLDETFPLESGLALAIPGDWKEGTENGLLQAWEVFEGVRVDADLVTLSACQTGLGKEVAGEGLLGLTWAFQYAGARSIVASLWEVGDASTAELMRAFYRHFAGGKPKAEALRAAQLELLHRPATSSPYFWSAFQLIGDGR